ncbi:MAG: Crp/Fnr family transcriptional regulator [Phenylobacterium sp.]|nr:Crp/Fnr family transcriptional regulator [Phenylobacterium sp.]MDO9433392.1 Crp/Fnr family transcriptional regulator [Phenylobacterium sp.]
MTTTQHAVPDAIPWFATLPADRQAVLLERARPSSVPAGSRIYGLGDPPDGLWSVVEGEVRLVSYPAIGVESVAMILGPGAWFGELSVVDGGPRPHDAVAVRPTRLLHVPLGAFEQIAMAHPILYRDLGVLVCARQRAALTFMAQAIAQPVSVRLARILGAAARAAGPDALRMRQEDLAAMIGVSRQTINKELKRLERAGMVELSYGKIEVREPQALRAIGQRDTAEGASLASSMR